MLTRHTFVVCVVLTNSAFRPPCTRTAQFVREITRHDRNYVVIKYPHQSRPVTCHTNTGGTETVIHPSLARHLWFPYPRQKHTRDWWDVSIEILYAWSWSLCSNLAIEILFYYLGNEQIMHAPTYYISGEKHGCLDIVVVVVVFCLFVFVFSIEAIVCFISIHAHAHTHNIMHSLQSKT